MHLEQATRQERFADREQGNDQDRISSRERQGLVQARAGRSGAGIWSRPKALLLEGRPILRFTKLDTRSRAIAARPMREPVVHATPSAGAQAEAAITATTTPRMVLRN